MSAPVIDWGAFQQELDAVFHTRHDLYPAGSPEHAELLTFVQRLHAIKMGKCVIQRRAMSNINFA